MFLLPLALFGLCFLGSLREKRGRCHVKAVMSFWLRVSLPAVVEFFELLFVDTFGKKIRFGSSHQHQQLTINAFRTCSPITLTVHFLFIALSIESCPKVSCCLWLQYCNTGVDFWLDGGGVLQRLF